MHVLIAVTQLVADAALDAGDSPDIAGNYVVEVRDDANDPTEEALDTFHETIGIACLDDFSILANIVNTTAIPAGSDRRRSKRSP